MVAMKKDKDYIRWRKMRAAHLALYPECRICGEIDKSNHVHHLVYRGKRGLLEKPGDVVTLCEFHHNKLHKYHKRGTNLNDFTLSFIAEEVLFLSYGTPVV